MQLKKTIGTVGLLCTSLSCMIGSGWLFGSFYAAEIAGPAAILSWLIGGCLIIFIALSFAELSCTFPFSGGIVLYSYFSHGRFVSFIMSWLAWLSCVAAAPSEVQATLQYLSQYFPSLITQVDGGTVLSNIGLVWATICMLLFSALNIAGIKTLIKYNNAVAIWKVLIPFATVFILAFTHFDTDNFTSQGFMPNGTESVFEALSAIAVFSYLGFRESTSLAGEVKNPQRAIPLSVIGSVIICMILYTTMQVVFIGSVDSSMITQGWSHINFSYDSGPFAGLAIHLGLAWLANIIALDSVVTPSGTALVYTATTSRLLYAMGKSKSIPSFFSLLNRHGIPYLAIAINFIIGLLLFFPLPTWTKLVKFQASAIVMAYAVGPVALSSLRKLAPEVKRPFKIPFPVFTSAVTFCICNYLVYWTGWETNAYLLIGILFGGTFYLLYNSTVSKQPLHITSTLWLIPHFCSLGIVSKCGTYDGGLNILSNGYDILVLTILSIIVYVLAYKSCLDTKTSKTHRGDIDPTLFEGSDV